ncbi:DUF732 domain-containing protein [Nocardia sp. NPDC050413]|uniref:DUF732 domain-containing protein n=1 Tax=Nocardia sp. NPDC050413 TaxID=3155784 RepID=UPI0033C15B54
MHRIPGKVAGSVAALAAVALLSACGDNDSTASQTPTLSSSASAAASATTQAPATSAAEDTTSAAPESETSAPEQPLVAPTVEETPATGKDKAFLDELGKNGIHPADQTSAITAATYICSAKSTGASDADIATFVAAMAGTDAAFDPAKMDVNKAAEIYIAAANATYC